MDYVVNYIDENCQQLIKFPMSDKETARAKKPWRMANSTILIDSSAYNM
jgi:hypothetical protein